MWLTRFNRPLAEAVGQAPDMLPGFTTDLDDADEALCDNGMCFT